MNIKRFEDIIAWQSTKGSCGESPSLIILSKDLNIITEAEFNELYKDSEEISKILSGLIKTLRSL